MASFRNTITVLIFLLCLFGVVRAPVFAQEDKHTSPVVDTLDGEKIQMVGLDRAKVVVFFFVSHDCPISNQYAAEFNRLHREYSPQGARFYLVYVDAELTATQARRHAAEYKFTFPAILDADHRLVKYAGATVTPEVSVFGSDQTRLYRGRIDDRFPSLNRRRSVVKSPDLRRALDAVLAGREAPTPVTKAIGCYITPAS